MADDDDRVFRAPADAGRRTLLDRLHEENGQTLNGLCRHLDVTRQAVTKHLAMLEAAGLVVVTWRGREKLHYLNPVPIEDIRRRWIGKFERRRASAWPMSMSRLKTLVETGRPLPRFKA